MVTRRVRRPVREEMIMDVPSSIDGDTCGTFTFTAGGKKFEFRKEGRESWVETVKYGFRNKKKLVVKYERGTDPGQVYEIFDGKE